MKTTDDANFRVGPGIDQPPLQQPLKRDTVVWPTGQTKKNVTGYDWTQVALSPVGWIASNLLTTDDAPHDVTFDPEEPTYIQRNDWTCSIGSMIWCLRSTGIEVTPEEAHDTMVPTYVNSTVGLKDGSGAGIVEALRTHWGVLAQNYPSISFQRAAELAGKAPMMLGGHDWGAAGHWVAVRRYEDGKIWLANPGGTGPVYGQQWLDELRWNERSPFSAVVITGRVA